MGNSFPDLKVSDKFHKLSNEIKNIKRSKKWVKKSTY
jgi:hypothetical protein